MMLVISFVLIKLVRGSKDGNVMELYFDPAERIKFQQEIERNGSVKNYEVKLRKKDGTEIECLVTSTVRLDRDGNILGYQGIVRDITERKQEEEKSNHIRKGWWTETKK